jgi:flagellar biosynthesis protein
MPEEKRRRATALRYAEGSDAPEVVATGAGEIARKILAAAEEAGVPVRQDPALVEALSKLDVGQSIPPELYVAVAEALVWAYRLEAWGARGGCAGALRAPAARS